MIPPQKEFERIPTDDFINTEIADIVYDEEHEFSVFGSEEKQVGYGVQFILNVTGLKQPRKTRWYKFSYDERSNLYKQFIAPLVQNAKPYMAFDLDQLKGMQVKILWKDDKDPRYQSIDNIRPAGKKVVPNLPQPPQPKGFDKSNNPDEEIPF